jgi:membrane protein implicated in regulation of membrane protease activity
MIVFITIAIIGFVLLVLALILGEIFEGDGDGDADDGAGVEDSQGGPSIFSFRFIACFITGFGGGGSIGTYYDLGYVVSSLIGVGSAVILAGILYLIVRMLYKRQSSSNVSTQDLTGKDAIVSIAIPANGVGEVSITAKGRMLSQRARTEDGSELKAGNAVTVTQVVGDKVIVAAKKGD